MADVLEEYSYRTFRPVDPVLREVMERARQSRMPAIHLGGMDARTLEIILRMASYRKVVEIGTLAGFSGICIARAIGPDGELHTVDCNPAFAEVARQSFEKAGVADIVKIYVGVALDVLEKKLTALGPFDAIFIDADKENYPNYLDWAEQNIRVGGAIFADNTYAFGHVWKKNVDQPGLKQEVHGIQVFNSRLADNPKFRATMLPTHQGMTMAVRLS